MTERAPESGRRPDTDSEKAAALSRMKRLATLLFLAATALFVVTRLLEAHGAWIGYVEAFAEAAMVGALADWFAVTALFRHPLGLPIPHTALIPTRKDQIGTSLEEFVATNFLAEDVGLVVLRRGEAEVEADHGQPGRDHPEQHQVHPEPGDRGPQPGIGVPPGCLDQRDLVRGAGLQQPVCDVHTGRGAAACSSTASYSSARCASFSTARARRRGCFSSRRSFICR